MLHCVGVYAENTMTKFFSCSTTGQQAAIQSAAVKLGYRTFTGLIPQVENHPAFEDYADEETLMRFIIKVMTHSDNKGSTEI
jgi:hypothetical protein